MKPYTETDSPFMYSVSELIGGPFSGDMAELPECADTCLKQDHEIPNKFYIYERDSHTGFFVYSHWEVR